MHPTAAVGHGTSGDSGSIDERVTAAADAGALRVLGRGLFGRCTGCGSGKLFRRWIHMEPHCPRCGLHFERVDGHWIGAIGINTILTFGTLLVATVVGLVVTYPEPPVVPLVLMGLGISIAMPVLIFPTSRTFWNAIDQLMRPLVAADYVDAPSVGRDSPSAGDVDGPSGDAPDEDTAGPGDG